GAGATARVVATALDGELLSAALDGIATFREARAIGRAEHPTMVLIVETTPEQRDEAKERLETLFARLGREGLAEDVLDRARQKVARAHGHPRDRLAAAWRGEEETPEVDGDAVRSWAKTHLAPGRLAWAHDE